MARYLALDWDHKQLHLIVATTGRGGAQVQRALVWQHESDPLTGSPEALGQQLRALLKGAGIASAPVLGCVGRDRVILKEIRYPQVPPSEEAAVVRFQASKELTDAPDDVIIDYTPLGEPGAAGEQRAIAVIVRRGVVNAYQSLCKAAGLKLVALVPRPFGIAASLGRAAGVDRIAMPESPDAVSAVLTVAEGWAEFCIVRGKTLLFARALPVSNTLAGEVRRNLAVYAGQPQLSLARDVVRALYVAGNGEEAALRERLQQLLAIPVHALDPFAPDAGVEVTPGSRAGFAGVVGLTDLWARRQQVPINLVRVKEPVSAKDPHRNRKLGIAAAVAVLFLVAAALGYQAVSARRATIDELMQEKTGLETRLADLAPDVKYIQGVRDWDDGAIRWIDEVYDLTARFPYREGVRVTQLSGTTVPRNPKDKDKDKTAVRMTVNGVSYSSRTDDRSIQELVDAYNHDGHTHASPSFVKSGATAAGAAPGARKQLEEFQLKIDIAKQKGRDYRDVLVPPPEAPPRGRQAADEEADDLGLQFFPGGGLP